MYSQHTQYIIFRFNGSKRAFQNLRWHPNKYQNSSTLPSNMHEVSVFPFNSHFDFSFIRKHFRFFHWIGTVYKYFTLMIIIAVPHIDGIVQTYSIKKSNTEQKSMHDFLWNLIIFTRILRKYRNCVSCTYITIFNIKRLCFWLADEFGVRTFIQTKSKATKNGRKVIRIHTAQFIETNEWKKSKRMYFLSDAFDLMHIFNPSRFTVCTTSTYLLHFSTSERISS